MKVIIQHDDGSLIVEAEVAYDDAIEMVNPKGGIALKPGFHGWLTMNIYEGHKGQPKKLSPTELPKNVLLFKHKLKVPIVGGSDGNTS